MEQTDCMISEGGCINSDLWVPKLVQGRLVEAVQIAQYTAGNIGPKGFGTGLPRELVEAIGVPEGDGEHAWWERESEEDERPARRPIGAKRITDMEEAIRWPMQYLGEFDGPARVLALYLRCKVYRKPFNEACKRRSWSRATAYRARDRAFGLIAQGLNRDGVRF